MMKWSLSWRNALVAVVAFGTIAATVDTSEACGRRRARRGCGGCGHYSGCGYGNGYSHGHSMYNGGCGTQMYGYPAGDHMGPGEPMPPQAPPAAPMARQGWQQGTTGQPPAPPAMQAQGQSQRFGEQNYRQQSGYRGELRNGAGTAPPSTFATPPSQTPQAQTRGADQGAVPATPFDAPPPIPMPDNDNDVDTERDRDRDGQQRDGEQRSDADNTDADTADENKDDEDDEENENQSEDD